MLHHAEVVGDEQVGQPEVVLQADEEIEDLRCTDTSSAETGSSQMIRSGLIARARAIPMRCRCPPEN
jgi:hypothetical protein